MQAAFDNVDLNLANITVNPATDCTSPEDGSIVIDFTDFTSTGAATNFSGLQIIVDGQNTAADDATYDAVTSATIAGNPASFTIDAMAPDTYDITINDITTGCISETYQIEIVNDTVEPTMAAYIEADNFCDGGNGYVRIEVATPTTTESDYTFSWYNGVSTDAADRFVNAGAIAFVLAAAVTNAGANGSMISGIPPTGVHSAGVPQARDSRITSPNPSRD